MKKEDKRRARIRGVWKQMAKRREVTDNVGASSGVRTSLVVVWSSMSYKKKRLEMIGNRGARYFEIKLILFMAEAWHCSLTVHACSSWCFSASQSSLLHLLWIKPLTIYTVYIYIYIYIYIYMLCILVLVNRFKKKFIFHIVIINHRRTKYHNITFSQYRAALIENI